MNVIFCHGVMPPELDWETREYFPDKFKWKYWLQFMIEKKHDVLMQTPKFPHAHVMLMKYPEWERIMNMQETTPETIIIGHSAGAGFVLKYLAKHSYIHVKQVILVAPWIDPDNEQPFGFYNNFEMNNDILNQTSDGFDIMISNDDAPYILDSVKKIKESVPDIRIHEYENKGHFLCPEIPEIFDILKFD